MNWLQKYAQGFRGLSKEVWILSVVLFINRSGTMVIPFMTVYLSSELSFSTTIAGVIVASYGVGSIGGTLLGGWLADRLPYKQVQFYSLVVSGLLFLVMSQCTSFWSLASIIALTSFAADVFRPANMASIRIYSNEGNRTRSLALQRLAINLGFGVGPAIGGFLASRVGFDSLFLADAATCIFASVFLFFLLPSDSVTERHKKMEAEEQIIETKMNPKFWLLIFSVLLYGVAFFQLIYAFPVFLDQAFAFSEDQIGWLLALNGFLIFLTEMPIVHAIEKRKNKFRILYWGLLLHIIAHAFLVPAALAPWTFCLLYVLFVSIGEILYLPFVASLALNMSHPKRVGRNMALFSVGFGMAHILGPSAGLFVADKLGFATFWVITIPFYIAVMLLTWFLLKKKLPLPKAGI